MQNCERVFLSGGYFTDSGSLMLKCPAVRHLEKAKERMGRKHHCRPESSKFSIKHQISNAKLNILGIEHHA